MRADDVESVPRGDGPDYDARIRAARYQYAILVRLPPSVDPAIPRVSRLYFGTRARTWAVREREPRASNAFDKVRMPAFVPTEELRGFRVPGVDRIVPRGGEEVEW